MDRRPVAFDPEVGEKFAALHVEELSPDAGPPPPREPGRIESFNEGLRLSGHKGSGVFPNLREGQIPKTEVVSRKQPGRPPLDFRKIPKIQTGKTRVVFPPEGRDRSRSDLDRSVDFDREVNAQKWLGKVRNGVDVGPDRTVFGTRPLVLEINPLEGQDRHPLGEAEIPGDSVGMETGRIDEGAVRKDRLPRQNTPAPKTFLVGGR